MSKKIDPNLKLFNDFVSVASLSLLRNMRKLINRQINKISNNDAHWNPVKGDRYSLKDKHIDNPKAALAILLEEDWSYLFSEYDDTGSDCYVYFHSDPNSAIVSYRFDDVLISFKPPFYVGMGRGNRAESLMRSVMHLNQLNILLGNGYSKSEIVSYFKKGLSEAAARELESKLILFFGVKTAIPESKLKKGTIAMSGRKFGLFNQKYEPFNDIYTKYAYNGFVKNIDSWSKKIK